MRALIQRVSEAKVEVATRPIGSIDTGLLILFCAVEGDELADAQRLAAKIAKLRIFEDDAGKMNQAVTDIGGDILVVSQFTLAADTRKGNRPSFISAAQPDTAIPLMDHFIETLRGLELRVETGEFGATMAVHLINDGPVTIWIDTRT
ncbi:MAG: D-aminoacyl-tRNA deacylase [Alphaproteobacteria bacterium]|nr:D-aminoacyl-tRNA deacylase [Alphaproteobacteria bacterium]